MQANSLKYWSKVYLSWISVIAGAHFLLRQVRLNQVFDFPQYWPISIMIPVMPVWQDLIVICASLSITSAIIHHYSSKAKFWKLLALSTLLIVSTNLFQGWREGFITPITGFGHEDITYWQDAGRIRSIKNYIKNYTIAQPFLRDHTRVHPPFAVIYYALLYRLHAPIIGSIVSLASIVFASWLIFKRVKSQFLALCVMLIPATQIYGIASLDATIMLLFIITMLAWEKRQTPKYFWIAILSMGATLCLTFAGVLLIALLPITEYLTTKKLTFSIKTLLLTLIGYIGIRTLLGYDYYQSLMIAREFENPGGFHLLSDPFTYIVTRVENIAEILVFFSPALSTLFLWRLKKWEFKSLSFLEIYSLTLVGLLMLFFLAGAYYTGETGRAAMYIYPSLLLLIQNDIEKLPFKTQKIFIIALIGQSILMQMLAWYKW